jgi:hypothetical protein
MIAEKVKKSNIGVGIGIVLEVLGKVLIASGGAMLFLGGAILLVGVGFFIWGCFNYSEGKGYPPILGLLGLASCFGLIILIVLPDKCKNGGPPSNNAGGSFGGSQPGSWPPPPSNPN